ncbi:uncharacterized protein EDB91DRAFT_1243412 [Suillus paluster]|uniref:uncharacterized protein n=1 Tax=Suillus paluster TaxID=48578 RepID=UPI001B863981|nr:uncharacterized protein EDB91DRAFT_1243412 [Suillus paluster]KAG1752649.1 hypothetical protein EDB91DRAFT_1243412 [Suillus paluster]
MPATLKRRHDDELVEDSEPEREEKRQQREQGRLARKKKRLRLDLQQADQDFIELTDSEPYPPGPSTTVGAQSQVGGSVGSSSCSPLTELASSPELEVTDDVVVGVPSLASGIAPDQRKHRVNAPDTTHGPYDAQKKLGTNCPSTCPTPPPIATLEVPLSSDSEGESRLKLSRFAFGALSSKTKVTNLGGLSRSGSAAATETLRESTSTTKARLKRPNVHRFSNEFSDTQLASLTNCVSCSLEWTSAKIASQKIVHIQNCAKKKCLSDETIRILIRKEIQSSSDQNASERGEQKTAEGEKSATFLETVVDEVSRTKRGRRPQVLGTVKSLPETRGSILGRARAVLDTSMQHGDSVVGARAQGGRSDVPCTQAFGTSMLARRTDSYPLAQSGPPQTQAFGESALGHLQSNLGLVVLHARTSGL